jgi:hypothetical protein
MLSFFLVLGGRKQLRNDDTTEVRNLLFSYFWEHKFINPLGAGALGVGALGAGALGAGALGAGVLGAGALGVGALGALVTQLQNQNVN